MKGTLTYTPEKRLKELFGLMAQDEVYIRETPDGTFIVTIPHPTKDEEYILSIWRTANTPKEFVDLGRATRAALGLGAVAVRFDLSAKTLQTI